LFISIGVHAVLLGAAILDGLVLATPDVPDEEIVLDGVEIISEAEFDAISSVAPEFVPTDTIDLGLPEQLAQDASASDQEAEVEVSDIDGPDDPSSRDGDPDLSAVRNAVRVDTTQETAELTAALPQAPVLGLARPTAPSARPSRPVAARPALGRPTPPRPSLNIDTRPSAPPPEETEVAEEEQTEIAEATEATEEAPVEEAQEETAPEEAATEIIPQVAEDDEPPATEVAEADPASEEPAIPEVSETDDPNLLDPDEQIAGAPLISRVPPARRPDEQSTVQEVATNEPSAEQVATVEDPAPETPLDPNLDPNGFPIGSPISASEREGLVDAIGQFWNTAILDGLPNAEQLVITVGVTLNEDGTILNNEVRPIEPANPQGAYARAFQAAQRAVLQAGFRGAINMPPEKYARWRELEITFNPGNNQIGF
jgi:hypothetical protein